MDPSERSKETFLVISYKIISPGYQANFPLQNSPSSTQTSSPSPVFPIFTQYPEELEGGGKNKARLLLHLAELWKMRQKSQGQRQGKGSALGTLLCCRNPSTIPEPSVHEPWQNQAGAATVPGRRMILQNNLLPCQAAVCTFQLIKPKDWGEFHKLNP